MACFTSYGLVLNSLVDSTFLADTETYAVGVSVVIDFFSSSSLTLSYAIFVVSFVLVGCSFMTASRLSIASEYLLRRS